MNAWMKFQSDSKMNKLCEWQNMRITLARGGGLGAKKLSIKTSMSTSAIAIGRRSVGMSVGCFTSWKMFPQFVRRLFAALIITCDATLWCCVCCLLVFLFICSVVLISLQTRTSQPLCLGSKVPWKQTLLDGCTLNDYNFIMVLVDDGKLLNLIFQGVLKDV